MPIAEIAGKRIFLAHIPKTGGSSLEAWMAEAGRLRWRGGKPLDGMRVSPQHMHAALYEPLLAELQIDLCFAVLRDPLARLMSEYRYRKRQVVRKGLREMPDFERWARRALRKAGEDRCFLDNHIRPQADFLHEGMRLFRFEDGLDAVFDWLEAQTGAAGLERPHKLRTGAEDIALNADLRADIADFYAEDHALIARVFGA